MTHEWNLRSGLPWSMEFSAGYAIFDPAAPEPAWNNDGIRRFDSFPAFIFLQVDGVYPLNLCFHSQAESSMFDRLTH